MTYPIAQKNYPSVYLLMIQNNMVFECDNLHHLESIMNEKLNSVFKTFNINKLAINFSKGWFLYDRRRSRIANRRLQRVLFNFHLIADDKKENSMVILLAYISDLPWAKMHCQLPDIIHLFKPASVTKCQFWTDW